MSGRCVRLVCCVNFVNSFLWHLNRCPGTIDLRYLSLIGDKITVKLIKQFTRAGHTTFD